ncbi:MAG: ATP-binding cassette domain-containing protein, partial [Paracoccaceae bacterium]
MRAMLLEVKDASVNYQKVSAIRNITLQAPASGIVTIIGGNGAGKTTTLRAISGLAKLSGGEIWFDGQRID